MADAANRFHICHNAIYEWKVKYNGHWKSLLDKAHRPHHHPSEHTKEEYELIRRYWPRNKDDRMILWMKIREKGYKRSYKSMCRALKRLRLDNEEKARHAYSPKPYAASEYPGQKVQIDVKYVPGRCVAGETKYYQYTAIDEYSRITFREMYNEHSTYSSLDFILKVIAFFPNMIPKVCLDFSLPTKCWQSICKSTRRRVELEEGLVASASSFFLKFDQRSYVFFSKESVTHH